jgi:hypothetical protein
VGSELADTLLPCASTEPRGIRIGADSSLVDCPVLEALAAAQQRDRPVLVLAGSGPQADDFRREHNLPYRKTIYATPQSVRGWSDVEIVVLPGFHERSDAERIWEALRPALLVRQHQAYPRWAGTEPQEVDPDLDTLDRSQLAELAGPASAVAEVLDEWRHRLHGIISSEHGVGLFLDLLAARGFRVEPIEAPAFADVLSAPTD